MLAIFKREFKAYFVSPTGYIFLGFMLFLSALFFTGSNYQNSLTDMTMYFNSLGITFLFMVPLLTMRLLAEDKRNKTDQLLITAPVSIVKIVLGKYFAAVALFGLYMVITLLYPFTLSLYGAPVMGTIITLYIGFFLLGASLISIGVFITSLTESQVTAAIASFAVILIIWFSGSIATAVNNKYVTIVVQWLSLLSRFNGYLTGIFDPSALLYYITFAALFIFLTVLSIEKRRWD